MKSNNGSHRITLLYVVATVAFALGIYNVFLGRSITPAGAQNDAFLSRRIDQVEQRFYMLESRLNRVESQENRSSILSPTTPNTNDIDQQFLRTSVDGLRTRVGELECGVLRLDERTLSPGVKAAHKTSTKLDPCRLDPTLQVQLSSRPN